MTMRDAFAGYTHSPAKALGVSHDELLATLYADFSIHQCQVTGRLSKPFYSDACLFEGPDPDMPVRGLAKYCSASSNLFDHALSTCDLLAIGEATDRATGETLPVVFWRIEGVVNLPWHPTIKPYVGATIFRTDEQGLVAQVSSVRRPRRSGMTLDPKLALVESEASTQSRCRHITHVSYPLPRRPSSGASRHSTPLPRRSSPSSAHRRRGPHQS
mmetsp:Transcript_45862/g.127296  ORF Transcript_45862/g.127296 Transcript_45862/m.127296 type:complete len:215 (+) Transcript_45862:624-1268(+)